MNRKELTKRYLLFIIGLFISAIGVAITKKGALGVSPISSVANVMSIRFPELTLGNWLILWNCVLIVGQILILRKQFQWIQLLQVPISFLFGWFTDFGMWMISPLNADAYPVRIGCVLVGTAVLGLGVAVSVIANVVMNSGEAFVKALSDVTRKDFGSVKIFFDISCVTLALILSLLLCDGTIVGAREGTVIAAVLTGVFVKLYNKCLKKPLEKRLVG